MTTEVDAPIRLGIATFFRGMEANNEQTSIATAALTLALVLTRLAPEYMMLMEKLVEDEMNRVIGVDQDADSQTLEWLQMCLPTVMLREIAEQRGIG